VGFSVDIYQDTFLVAASNLPGNILVSLVIDKVGRKNLLGYTLSISTGLVVVLAFAQESKFVVVTLACVFNAISCGCWNTLDCLSTESFPTKQRTTAMV
jgi:MFS family permease